MSQGWIETRIAAVEQRVEWLIRQVQDLIPQLRAALQQARNTSASYGGGGGGGGGSLFAMPGSTVAAATGTYPTGTPASFTANVYTTAGGTMTLSATGATIYNWFPAALTASKICFVVADGTGDYVVVTQSCT
jgi:hypothetical protein